MPLHSPDGPRARRWQLRDGRWSAGWNAPGGWNRHRRRYGGLALPGYWMQPAFVLGDRGRYGLARPPYGYNWTPYYDDAVLVDLRGSVYDTVEGIDRDGGYAGEWRADDRYCDGRRDDGLRGVATGASPRGSPADGASRPGGQWRSPDGTTVVTTTAGGDHGGDHRGDHRGGTTTTVVVPAAPVVTTTTEIHEDAVTDPRPVVRRPARRR